MSKYMDFALDANDLLDTISEDYVVEYFRLYTVDDMDDARSQARDEGYEEGFQEGFKEGFGEGQRKKE